MTPNLRSAWLSLALGACATTPRPMILTQVDSVRSEVAIRETAELAPQAIAQAEHLRADAEAAWPKGDIATAQILAERALAAYAHARVLAHIVATEQRLVAANAEVQKTEAELLALEAAKTKTAAEAADYEAQLRVAKEAETLADPAPASAEREQARRVAARTALVQARLLCLSAILLDGEASRPAEDAKSALADLDAIEAKLASTKTVIPIRDAIAARSRCQLLLTGARRAALSEDPTNPEADELFVELARAGFVPSRDERGIVVNFGKPFASSGLSREVESKLQELVTIAKQRHASTLLVVTHSRPSEPPALEGRRLNAVLERLRSDGVSQVQGFAAGARLPVAQSTDLSAASRNERLEVVFVTRQ
jgi:hypothetical protein